LLFLVASLHAAEKSKLNVLFIAVDDLRPELGCYGNKQVRSPHLDKLAAGGIVFQRAYCQQAVCSPSRTSLLTGRRPDTTRVYDLVTHFRDHIPDVVPLPERFKQHGYHTQAVGKIYHGGYDDPKSWSAPHETGRAPGYGPEGQALLKKLRDEARKKKVDLSKRQNQPRGLPWEAPDIADNQLTDGATADRAIELLGKLKDRPFFLGVGFLKPHLPFVAPKKYWDLYKADDFKLAVNPDAPKDAPAYALHNSGELRQYHTMPKMNAPFSKEQQRNLIHGYYACISYLDAQVGRVLAELDRLKLADRTIVIVWGDHGWFLGEHGLWCKHANYELATRAALLLRVPGQKSGLKTDALVEFVDIYPTLIDLCDLPPPAGLEGASFRPLLDNPKAPWKRAAFSQYPRQIPGKGRAMGYAMRTDRYRLVEWSIPGKEFREYELYDHQTDPGENVNLAKKPEHAATVKALAKQLRGGWQMAWPGR
jgi:arylsulfatase A-like enzyme